MQLRKVKGKKDPRGWLVDYTADKFDERGGFLNLILKTDLNRISDLYI